MSWASLISPAVDSFPSTSSGMLSRSSIGLLSELRLEPRLKIFLLMEFDLDFLLFGLPVVLEAIAWTIENLQNDHPLSGRDETSLRHV